MLFLWLFLIRVLSIAFPVLKVITQHWFRCKHMRTKGENCNISGWVFRAMPKTSAIYHRIEVVSLTFSMSALLWHNAKMIRKAMTIASLLIPTLSFAAGFFCPSSNQYVYTGNSLNTVLQRCGAPNATKEVAPTTSKTTEPGQRWIYDYQPAQYNKRAQPVVAPGQALLTIYFNTTEVIHILVNGHSVQTTSYCGDNPKLKVGMDYLQVRAICSVPSQIRNIQLPQQQKHDMKTEWTYDNGGYSPTTLVFQNSVLTEIKQ